MSTRRSLGWVAGGQGAYFFLQFISSVILARLLSPYEVGIFSVAFAAAGLITVLQSLGLNNYLIREANLTPDVSATVFSINSTVAIILAFTIAGFGIAGGRFFHEPGVRHVLLYLSVIPLIAAVGFLPLALIERDGDFRSVSLIKTLGTLTGTIATLLFALAGQSYMSFAYGQIISASVSTITAIVLAPHYTRFAICFTEWRDIQRFGLQVLATTGVSRIAARTQELFLGQLIGLSALGLYSRAGNIFSMLWDSISLVICRVAFVDFAASARAGNAIGPRYRRALHLLTALMWPAFAGLGVLAGPFVFRIYGPKWISVAPLLSLFCIVGVLYTAVAMTWDLFLIANETGRQARFEFIRSIFGVTVFALGCTISLEAAVAARILDAAFAFVLYTPHILRFTESRIGEIWKIYASSSVLAAAAVFPSVALMMIYRWSPDVPIAAVAGSVSLGIAFWFVLLRFMRHELFHEIQSIATRRKSIQEIQ